jgi:hypothetical protein
MYILVYPPAGKQLVGNVESVNKLEEIVLRQVSKHLVKVIQLPALSSGGQPLELCYIGGDEGLMSSFLWMPVKTLDVQQASDIGNRVRSSLTGVTYE